jgi:hypothetical protein
MTNAVTFHNLALGGVTTTRGLPGSPWSVGTPVSIAGTIETGVVVVALQNDTFVVAYEKGAGNPTYVRVYGSDGVAVGSEIEIITDTNTGFLTMGTLTNGNVVISFKDQGDAGQSKFMILSPTGSTVKGITDVSPGVQYCLDPPVIPQDDGGFIILYNESGVNFQAVVYNAAGTEVNRPPAETVTDMYVSHYVASPLPGGGALVFYSDDADLNMHYLILNASGVITHTELNITGETYDQYYPYCTVLDNGNYFFTWYDDYDEYAPLYAIYGSDNSVVKAAALLQNNGNYYNGGMAVLVSGIVMVQTLTADNWYIELYQEDGTFIEDYALVAPIGGTAAANGRQYCAELSGGKLVVATPHTGGNEAQFVLLTGTAQY